MLNCINFIFYAVHALFMKHDAYFYTRQQYFIICLRHLRHTNYILPGFFYSIVIYLLLGSLRSTWCKFQRKMQLKVTYVLWNALHCGKLRFVAICNLGCLATTALRFAVWGKMAFLCTFEMYLQKIHFMVNNIFVRYNVYEYK